MQQTMQPSSPAGILMLQEYTGFPNLPEDYNRCQSDFGVCTAALPCVAHFEQVSHTWHLQEGRSYHRLQHRTPLRLSPLY